MKVEKALLICFVGIFLLMVLWIKILGITDIPIDVEKNGYCKQYGEDWNNVRGENLCRNKYYISKEIEDIDFSEEEFRNYCPKNEFLSTKFYSDCFHKSGSIV